MLSAQSARAIRVCHTIHTIPSMTGNPRRCRACLGPPLVAVAAGDSQHACAPACLPTQYRRRLLHACVRPPARRGNDWLYVGAGSIPMLPPVLAHGALSLTQGQPRPVLSLWLTVVDGKVVSSGPRSLPPSRLPARCRTNMRAGSAHSVCSLSRSYACDGLRGPDGGWVHVAYGTRG